VVQQSVSELLGIDVEKKEENTNQQKLDNQKDPNYTNKSSGKKKQAKPKSMLQLAIDSDLILPGKLNDVLVEKRIRDEEDDESDLEGEEVDPDAEIPGLKKSKKRRKKEEYEAWKKKVIEKDTNSKVFIAI